MGNPSCSGSTAPLLGVVFPHHSSPFPSPPTSPHMAVADVAESQATPANSSPPSLPGSPAPAADPRVMPSPQPVAAAAVAPPSSTVESDDHPTLPPPIFPPGDWSSPLPAPAVATAPPPPPEMGQMVCGSCRQLLSYPQHANCVRCTCCQTINLVLEAHQVGNVKCGKCCILLMYPYGAPAVRCSCCRFVTEIGAHNMRPPLSVQQGPPPVPQNPIY